MQHECETMFAKASQLQSVLDDHKAINRKMRDEVAHPILYTRPTHTDGQERSGISDEVNRQIRELRVGILWIRVGFSWVRVSISWIRVGISEIRSAGGGALGHL
jgi:hypothetical protein